MRALFEVYRVQLNNWIAVQVQYRVAALIWLLGTMLEPVIYLVVWSTVARTTGGAVGGYAPGDFAAYFLVLMLVDHLTFTWVMWEYEYRVREGTLSFVLLRPLHPIHRDVAENLSYKLLTLLVLLPTALLLWLFFGATLELTLWAALAFVPALLLAFVLRFLAEWALALSAFWTTRVSAINQMYYVAALFLSGQIAPLSLFADPIQLIANLLPFRWMIAFPVELFLGRLTPRAALAGFGAQIFWLLLTLLLLRFVWRAGVRRYSAVGA